MTLSKDEIIAKFNEKVNMTVEELEAWLDDPESQKAGTGVGLESGRKIIDILKKNPGKVSEDYDKEDLEHMRKVVGYHSRHLAQEGHLKDTKTEDELEHTKSTISLKNWGHDPLKKLEKEDTKAKKPRQETDEEVAERPAEKESEESSSPEQVGPETEAEGGGTKRKLEEREESDDNVDAAIEPSGDKQNGEEVEVDEGEGHTRKKSKTNGKVNSDE